MSLPADYHMHTPLCHHAVGEPTEYAAQAVRVGLSEIGFSEHSPMPRDDFDDWRMLLGDLGEYVAKINKARRDHPGLSIKLALEVDYLPGHEDWIRELATRHPWDYLIGAVHYVSDSWDLDNPKKISEWKDRDPFEVWSAYFERLTRATESGLFEIIAHADLCKKFCFYHAKDCGEIYPSPQIVNLAAQMRVPITFASDAHAPGEVGMNFAEAVELAGRAGYTHCCRFAQRRGEEAKF